MRRDVLEFGGLGFDFDDATRWAIAAGSRNISRFDIALVLKEA
jgi:hypothetical protein